ncbi:hypothetical protein [Luteolibacter marinus]|uniref:hypothetical protein n=1 Tax=Luteolibacter marinus TaxID=2776705 RepID=UPI0018672EA9|nr:hypothetical protein [Luteolibacter marinus]
MWERDPDTPGHYIVTWDDRWIDRLTLSGNGRLLTGSNNNDESITAERISKDGRETKKTAAVGTWKWFSGATVVIKANGESVDETRNGRGTWKIVNGGSVEITWDGGDWVDTMVVSSDLQRMSGTNQNGDRISAERAPE